jgi:glycosyltransferase involved in cell wall biosynthesis
MSNTVSVIIPCYNRSALLRQAISSCACQTHQDLEVIVVDDGSEEDLRGAVDAARSDGFGERLKYVRQERKGGGSARNSGFAIATGAFVQFLDSDDLLHPEKLATQVAQLTAKPDLDMVYCLDEQFAESVGDIRMLWNVPRSDVADDLDRFLIEDTVWQTGSPLWRRASLERFGPWDETLGCWQDWDFHIRALSAGLRCECTGRVLQYIRRHNGPCTRTIPMVLKERNCFRAGKNAWEYLSRNGRLDDVKKRLLLGYFLKHLVRMGAVKENGAAQLQREILTFMEQLASTSRRRLAIRSMRFMARTPMFKLALLTYMLQTSYETRISSLRDVVHCDFLPPPPPELNDIVRIR